MFSKVIHRLEFHNKITRRGPARSTCRHWDKARGERVPRTIRDFTWRALSCELDKYLGPAQQPLQSGGNICAKILVITKLSDEWTGGEERRVTLLHSQYPQQWWWATLALGDETGGHMLVWVWPAYVPLGYNPWEFSTNTTKRSARLEIIFDISASMMWCDVAMQCNDVAWYF